MKSSGKKSQIEMFGLAFIIMLVVIGFFLYIKFVGVRPQPDPLQDYVDEQTASNFINSVILVHVEECYANKYTVEDLLRSCAKDESVSCGSLTDPCDLANSTIKDILDKSLIRQNFAFRLYTEDLGWDDGIGENIDISNNNCNSETERTTYPHPIALYPLPRTIYINMDICEQ